MPTRHPKSKKKKNALPAKWIDHCAVLAHTPKHHKHHKHRKHHIPQTAQTSQIPQNHKRHKRHKRRKHYKNYKQHKLHKQCKPHKQHKLHKQCKPRNHRKRRKQHKHHKTTTMTTGGGGGMDQLDIQVHSVVVVHNRNIFLWTGFESQTANAGWRRRISPRGQRAPCVDRAVIREVVCSFFELGSWTEFQGSTRSLCQNVHPAVSFFNEWLEPFLEEAFGPALRSPTRRPQNRVGSGLRRPLLYPRRVH